jgi:hypothetical protein
MKLGPLLPRAATIPARHILLAFGIAAALGLGAWWWSQMLPVEYVSSALLSYETAHNFLRDSANAETDPPMIRIAESVLSPQTLSRLADQVQFPPNPSAAARSDDFRSHLEFVQPAAGLLQVSYRGMDGKQVVAATNAVAGALAAWVPGPARAPADTPTAVAVKVPSTAPAPTKYSPPPASAAPTATQPVNAGFAQDPRRQAAELRRRAVTVQENNATLSLQLQGIERKISELTVEERNLEGSLSPVPLDDAAAAKGTNLAAVVKQLGSLRLMRGTLVTDIESQYQQMQNLRAQAAAIERGATVTTAPPPPVRVTPAPVPVSPVQPIQEEASAVAVRSESSSDSTQEPAWQGAFSVVAWGEKPLPLGDTRKKFVLWSGLTAAIVLAAFYLALIAWHFRPVSDLAGLRRALPGGVKYFGAVSGSPLTEKSS